MLVDTGILLRLFVPADPVCSTIRRALKALRSERVILTAAFQNAAEFWNVSTRPLSARAGYGWSPSIVYGRLKFIERLFPVVTESAASYILRKALVSKFGVQGVGVHDARLVAIMKCEAIDRILTLNRLCSLFSRRNSGADAD